VSYPVFLVVVLTVTATSRVFGQSTLTRCASRLRHMVCESLLRSTELTCTDRTIKVWDRESGNCVQTLVGHRGAVTSLQLSDDMIVSGSGEFQELDLWYFARPQLVRRRVYVLIV
jgi:WD40 repeat protein